MKWLTNLFHAADDAAAARGPTDDFWYSDIGYRAPAGMPVTAETAIQLSAVYDCQNVVTDPIATLPLKLFRRGPDGANVPVPEHPLADVLARRANNHQTACEFRGEMQWNLALYHNAYAEIRPGPRGAVDQLIPIHPDRVMVRRIGEEGIGYTVRLDDGRIRDFRDDQIWHLKTKPLSANRLTGRGKLETSRNLLSSALALQDYADRFFGNDTTSGGVIEVPEHFKTPEDAGRFIAAWRAQSAGAKRHRDRVLSHGATYKGTSQTNEQAQFNETAKLKAVEIARVWNVPPHKIGILDRATFSNIEQQALEFVIDTMMPWLVLWEQSIGHNLIVGDDVFFAEFNVAGLLRGDMKARFQSFGLGRQWGWLSVNDIRKLENMNPITGGDIYLQPVNMAPAGAGPMDGRRETDALAGIHPGANGSNAAGLMDDDHDGDIR